MKAVIATEPVIEPVDVEDLQLDLRLDDSDVTETALLNSLIKTARVYAENVTNRAMLTQTWDYYLTGFPSANYIKLPFGNLQSVTHVKYTDSDGDQTTMTVTDEYLVETNGEGIGRVVLPYGESWPSFTAYPSNPVVIRFVCGWTTAELIPYPIKAAIKRICADLYEWRGESVLGAPIVKNDWADRILFSYKLWNEF